MVDASDDTTVSMVRTGTVIQPDLAPVRGDIRQLTGLRGLAALDVVLTHYGVQQLPGIGLFGFGNVAVDLFFCLSSFTLCLVYGAGLLNPLRFGPYLIARVARVYPLFLVTMLVTLSYSLAWKVADFPTTTPVTLALQFVRQALLLSDVPLSFWGSEGSWNAPAWSISVEAFCYVLAFPPLFALTRRARRLSTDQTVLLALLLSAVCYVLFILYFDPYVNDPFSTRPAQTWSLWLPLIRGFTMFGAGWAAYLLYLKQGVVVAFFGSITDTLAIAFLVVIAAEGYGLLAAELVVVIAPFLILSLMSGRGVTTRILASHPVHFLGVISYSLYLWHLPLRTICMRFWPWAEDANLFHRIGYPLLVTLIVSTLSFYLMERPARRAIRRLARSPRTPSGVQDGPRLNPTAMPG